ncbi:MAG: hypothetical protein HRT45_05495, partial [Bdellovibrionales bacterium]|nr:hypothetical protein [Bdellovibrionales bacterium]
PGVLVKQRELSGDQFAEFVAETLESGRRESTITPLNIYMLGDHSTVDPRLNIENLFVVAMLHEILHYADIHRVLSHYRAHNELPEVFGLYRFNDHVAILPFELYTFAIEIRAYLAQIRHMKMMGVLTPQLELAQWHSLERTLVTVTKPLPRSENPLYTHGLVLDQEAVDNEMAQTPYTEVVLDREKLSELDQYFGQVFSQLN